MNKQDALMIFATAIVREILREDGPKPYETAAITPEVQPYIPQPNLDPSDDYCEHGGMQIPRAQCPVHSDEAQEYVPTAEELDDLTQETFEEENPMIARARRLAEQKKAQASERLFPEDLPLRGMGPPDELPPNIVV